MTLLNFKDTVEISVPLPCTITQLPLKRLAAAVKDKCSEKPVSEQSPDGYLVNTMKLEWHAML